MIGRQLELGFENGRACRSGSLRHRRRSRGHEWFARMRQVVENALDRTPEPKNSWGKDQHSVKR
jgi:hypothetical protein